MFVYTIQRVVRRFDNPFDNRFDNRLYSVNGALVVLGKLFLVFTALLVKANFRGLYFATLAFFKGVSQ